MASWPQPGWGLKKGRKRRVGFVAGFFIFDAGCEGSQEPRRVRGLQASASARVLPLRGCARSWGQGRGSQSPGKALGCCSGSRRGGQPGPRAAAGVGRTAGGCHGPGAGARGVGWGLPSWCPWAEPGRDYTAPAATSSWFPLPQTLAGGRAGPPAPGWLLLTPGSKASGGGCSYHGADAVRGGGADGVVVRVCRCVHSAVTRSKHSGGR